MKNIAFMTRIACSLILLPIMLIFTGCPGSGGENLPPPDTFYRPNRPASSLPDALDPSVNLFETVGGGISANRVFYDESGILVKQEGYILTLQGPFGRMEYNVDTGFSKLFQPSSSANAEAAITQIHTELDVNGQRVRTFALTRDALSVFTNISNSGFGTAVRVTVENLGGSNLIVMQNFYIYPNRNHLVFNTIAEIRGGIVSTNYIAPFKAGVDENSDVLNLSAFRTGTGDMRFLSVPFDNDEWVRYNSRPLLNADSESYDVTAIFCNTSRRAFITGSLTHDTWKTGIRLLRNNTRVHNIRLFDGITSYQTRDTGCIALNPAGTARAHNCLPFTSAQRENVGDIVPQPPCLRPHGFISGEQVSSSTMFLGFFNDWRDGMEEYGRAVGILNPPLFWAHGVPFGWNHWSAVGGNIDLPTFISASDFIRDHLPTFNNGVDGVWVNFDAFWTNLTEAQRRDAARHVRQNNQNAGIYHTPFATWHNDIEWLRNSRPEGATQWTWYDLVLKRDGEVLPYVNYVWHNGRQQFEALKGWPLDPTHPGTIAHNDLMVRRFREWGFSFVKLDFMSHGTMEGDFFNPNITTGRQAFYYGMQRYLDSIGRELIQGNFFVSFSIAPLFPSRFAHARRISCDIFGRLKWTEYVLNSLTYAWWVHRHVYPFNDADAIVVVRTSHDGGEAVEMTFNEGLSRYIATAITGGLMMFGEDITRADGAARAKEILNNPRVNALAASERTFRPVEGNTGHNAATLFVRDDREIDGSFFLASFNLNMTPGQWGAGAGRPTTAKTIEVDLDRIGLNRNTDYVVVDVISGATFGVLRNSITITMAPGEPRIFMFTRPNN